MLLKLRHFMVPVFYAVAMLYSVYNGFAIPNRNWDMICYVGSVTAWQEKTPDAIYSSAMGTLQKTIPDWMYQQFIANPLSATPQAYVQQIPFCQVKPLYNVALWLLHMATGMPLTIASWVTSALCFAALSVLLFLWRPRYLPRDAWLLMVVALTYIGDEPMFLLARLSTPDMLSALLTVMALFFWVSRHSPRGFFIAGLLAMLARPDAIIPIGALTAYFGVLAPKEHRLPLLEAGLFIVVLLLTTFVVKHVAQPANYTYEHFFIYSFFNKIPNPAEMTDHLSWDMYWSLLCIASWEFVSLPHVIVLIALSLTGAFCYYMKPVAGNRIWLYIMLIAWGSLGVRFILWPASHENRFYFGYWLIILRAAGELIAPYASVLWKMLQAHRRRIQT